MKRVYCLYRVSTKGQVDKDDIPMQRLACQEFAQIQGWDIVGEFSEKGVSGYKISTQDRDVVQQIKADALMGKFDILLVFMFDRLGRRDDETPFVVEWFVKNGIEVWSTQEGQQRFDDHVDKLMNYIRYWQASGESLKISVRTKTRLAQIVKDGYFKGGTIAYGYNLYKDGRFNKKNRELYEIELNEAEAEVVKTIFNKTIQEGYGSHRLAVYLNEKGILTKKGNEWQPCSVNNILKNPMYLGILRCNDTYSDPIPELQIIDEETFAAAQNIIKQRSRTYKENRTVPMNTKGMSLLSGYIFCGHCGARLVTTTNKDNRKLKDGTEKVRKRVKYACYNRTRKINIHCEGQSVYEMKKVDQIVTGILHDFFDKIKSNPVESAVDAKFNAQVKIWQANYNRAKNTLNTLQGELTALQSEVVKIIQGKSKFSADTLNTLIMTTEQKIAETEKEAITAQLEFENKQGAMAKVTKEYNKFINWSDVFDSASMEAKKMIVAQLIKRVRLWRGYKIDVEFNIDMEQFTFGM